MASVVTLVAALITCVGTVAAAVITTRQRGPAGITLTRDARLWQGREWGGEQVITQPGPARISRCLWCGIAGLFLWTIPLLGYCVIIPGLWIGIREMNGPRRRTTAGMVMCVVALIAAVINSVIGAYQGAHGQLWFQQG